MILQKQFQSIITHQKSMNNTIFHLQESPAPGGEKPFLLAEAGNHKIYWLGIPEDNAFRTNTYLVIDNNEALLIDPGNRSYFSFIRDRVAMITDPASVYGMVLCHQDPDVAASMVDWLDLNPKIKVISSARTNVLLPHYGKSEYDFYDIAEHKSFVFSSGSVMQFIEAPFMHFPGAFTTFDLTTGILFSGDIWAALDMDMTTVVENFDEHSLKLNLFHLDYMASNVATRGFARKIKHLPIQAIFPQHGALITEKHVHNAINYLENLQCGLDLIYPSY
jgi:flavorubredoxin